LIVALLVCSGGSRCHGSGENARHKAETSVSVPGLALVNEDETVFDEFMLEKIFA
jgi:hypothetical protein